MLAQLEAVLARRQPILSLQHLAGSFDQSRPSHLDLRSAAIAIDANVLLRLSNHKRSADILDYLPTRSVPTVVPGQVVQEFWNNQLAVMDTVSAKLGKQFDALTAEIERLEPEAAVLRDAARNLLTEFESNFGYVWQDRTRDALTRMFTILTSTARSDYVPRDRFSSIASSRKSSKTPPGFKDDGDGDFLVWADLLFSLLKARSEQQAFSGVALITNDVKKDWSSGGIPHPILRAEVSALFDCPLVCLTLDEFASDIVAILDAD
jgi:hypothetical protein